MKSITSGAPLPIILDSDRGISTPDFKGFGGPAAPAQATHEEILQRAYSIWECAGRPGNCELANWLKAEAEVLAEV